MKNRFLRTLLATALLALAPFLDWAPEPVLAVDPCPDAGGTAFLVNSAALAAGIAGGYNNPACNIIISVNVSPGVQNWLVLAKTATLNGPLTILNPAAGGKIVIATIGDITAAQALLIASEQVKLACSQAKVDNPPIPACQVNVAGGALIASNTLAVGGPGGEVLIDSNGSLNVQQTTLWGGKFIKFVSSNGAATVQCSAVGGFAAAANGDGCVDPAITPSALIRLFCGDPVVFPCKPVFETAAELAQTCSKSGGDTCDAGGGLTEIDIKSKTGVNLAGATILGQGVFVIKASDGPVNLAGATITSTRLSISGKGDGVLAPVLDLRLANLLGSDNMIITAFGCAAGPALCIDMTGATLLSPSISIAANNPGLVRACAGSYTTSNPGFPRINGVVAPPYTIRTQSTAVECAPDAAGTFN